MVITAVAARSAAFSNSLEQSNREAGFGELEIAELLGKLECMSYTSLNPNSGLRSRQKNTLSSWAWTKS